MNVCVRFNGHKDRNMIVSVFVSFSFRVSSVALTTLNIFISCTKTACQGTMIAPFLTFPHYFLPVQWHCKMYMHTSFKLCTMRSHFKNGFNWHCYNLLYRFSRNYNLGIVFHCKEMLLLLQCEHQIFQKLDAHILALCASPVASERILF